MEEFFKQGDKEQEQGLDFSPLCDRQNTMVPQSQIGKLSRNIWCQIGGNIIWCQIGEAWKYRLKCFFYVLYLPYLQKNKETKNAYPGFIDFIVSPTLAVCGDMVAAVLGEETEVRKLFLFLLTFFWE